MPQQERNPNDWMFSSSSSRQSTEQLPVIQARRPARQSRERGMKLFIWLMSLVLIAIVLLIGARIASESLVKPIVADRVEAELNEGVQTFVNQELTSLPAPVDSEPQEYLISEAEINQRIAEQQNLGPLDDATAEINNDGIVVHLEAYRMSGTYRAQVAASNGAVILRDGSLSGPLSYVIPVDELERVTNEAILGSLAASNVHITDVTLVDGEIVLTMESTGAGYGIPNG